MRTSMFNLDSFDAVFSTESMREVRIRNRFKRRGAVKADESRIRDSARHQAARYGRHLGWMGA